MNEDSHELSIFPSGTAIDYYRLGVQYSDVAFRCLGEKEGNDYHIIKDGKICIIPSAAVVNAAFSCEILLKALLMRFNGDFPKKHELDLLYRYLPDNVKKDIAWFCLKTDISGCEIFLEKHSRDFIDARYYIGQRKRYGMNPLMIVSLSFNLSQVAKAYLLEECE